MVICSCGTQAFDDNTSNIHNNCLILIEIGNTNQFKVFAIETMSICYIDHCGKASTLKCSD
jgi:hypothetical protein